ncbi:MAG: dTMP kinase [Actinobacteria bacterium]|uniref:dTMP kinase n=1 Tax=freshwater metagenome TaxID=449393 RepID=A0A6J6QJI9_9ZZZZ|nr:dTMP kinase [Actinomycetota bacterium]
MFISFEGVDGSGKSTQAGLLASALREAGFEVIETREPGGTPLGEQVRTMLLHGADMTPWAEAALFAASRAQHVEAVIRPALERGAWVVCDRYVDSSVVYQGVVRGLGAEAVYDLNRVVTRELMPQQTFVLDLDAATSRARQDGELDRIEREDDSFRARVVAAYRDLASRDPERVVVLDASLPVAELAERIRERVLAG